MASGAPASASSASPPLPAAWLPPPAAAGTVGARASRRGLCGAPLRLASPAHPARSAWARPPAPPRGGDARSSSPGPAPGSGEAGAAGAEGPGEERQGPPPKPPAQPSVSSWAPNVPTHPQKESSQPRPAGPVLGVTRVKAACQATSRARARASVYPQSWREEAPLSPPELPSLPQTLHWISGSEGSSPGAADQLIFSPTPVPPLPPPLLPPSALPLRPPHLSLQP